MNPGVPTFVIF